MIIIEHLEPKLYDWCKIEYSRISRIAGKDNLLFTNISHKALEELGNVDRRSIKELKFEKACILDPEANEELTPEKAKQFEHFIFGGILGDNPPKDRTQTELTRFLHYPSFNLGKDQMSTDTAVHVVQLIRQGKKLSELEFIPGLEIEVEEGLTVTLPYKYLILDEEVQIDPGIIEQLREQEGI